MYTLPAAKNQVRAVQRQKWHRLQTVPKAGSILRIQGCFRGPESRRAFPPSLPFLLSRRTLDKSALPPHVPTSPTVQSSPAPQHGPLLSTRRCTVSQYAAHWDATIGTRCHWSTGRLWRLRGRLFERRSVLAVLATSRSIICRFYNLRRASRCCRKSADAHANTRPIPCNPRLPRNLE